MAWTAPRTWVAAETLTAALLNTHVRDNLLESAPAKVTTKGDLTVATAANSISRLAVGSNGAVLVADSAAAAGVRWSSTGKTVTGGVLIANNLGATLTAAANNDVIVSFSAGIPVLASVTYTGLTVYGIYNDASAWTKSGTGTITTAYGLYLTAPTIGTTNWALYGNDGNYRLGGTSSKVFIGDDANANMTAGLTVNVGSSPAQPEALSIKHGSAAHGVTSFAETDTVLAIRPTATQTVVWGFGTAAVGNGVLSFLATSTAANDTTKATTSGGAFVLQANEKSGTSITNMTANSNIVVFGNNTTARFILDSDGDSHQDVGTAWTNYDTYDDAHLLTALSVHVSRPDDPIRENFREFLDTNRAALEDARLVTFNDDGHHFVNMSKLAMLHTGAIRQLSDRLQAALSRLELAERKLALIG